MRIEGNHHSVPGVRIEKPATPAKSAPGLAAPEFEESRRLTEALTATPETRVDQVARAKELLAGASYPSDQDLEKLAGLLAEHLGRKD